MAVKKSFLNAFEKASKTTYFNDLRDGRVGVVAVNPFSGVRVSLTNGLEATIYDFCTKWYSRYQSGRNTETPVSVYDNMRYYFLSLNPRAYMELLD